MVTFQSFLYYRKIWFSGKGVKKEICNGHYGLEECNIHEYAWSMTMTETLFYVSAVN